MRDHYYPLFYNLSIILVKNLPVQGKVQPWDPLKGKRITMHSLFLFLSGDNPGFSWLPVSLKVTQGSL